MATALEYSQADGAAYNPKANDWRPLPAAPLGPRHSHLAVWTGREMLVWGGYTSVRPKPPAGGAAYNPRTGRWRTLAPSPMQFVSGPESVWADGEWIIATARERTGEIEINAYDPARDRWRELPSPAGTFNDENGLVWTGSELLLIAGTIYRRWPGGPSGPIHFGDAWIPDW